MRSGFQGQELKDDNLFGFVLSFLILVSKFEMFILFTSIPRFKFLHICYIFPILVSVFEMFVLNA